MPGPVPPVSAQSGFLLLGSKDGVTPSRDTHDDLLPPPPTSEPFEVFLACVGHATSNTSGPATQPAAAARPSASVTTVTTGNRLPTPFPTYEVSSWMHQSQVQASRIRMPLPASFYTASPLPWVWPGRGSTVATSVVRTYQPVMSPAALTGHPGSTGHFPGSFPGGPTPVSPPVLPARPDTDLHSATPRAFAEFFRVTRTISPSQPGRTGINLLVMLHLSQPWVPLFRPRTWAPTRCGSWVRLMTERRHGLSVRPDQNEQTAASVRAVDPARGLLLTDIGPGSDTAKCVLTPPPRPNACLPSSHWFTLSYPPPSPPTPALSRSFFEWPVPYRPASRYELGSICWWRSTSANRGSHYFVREHGPQPAAAAKSLWRPGGVTGSA